MKALSTLLIWLPALAWSENTPKPPIRGLPNFQCISEIQKHLQAGAVIGDWISQAPTSEGESFRSPTLRFGVWSELVINSQKFPILYFVSNQKTERIEFDHKCKETITEPAGLDFSKLDKSAHFMDDADLYDFIKKHGSGMIYVWSPGMIYSVQNFKRFQKAAKDHGLEFLPLVNPRASQLSATQVGDQQGLPRLQSHLNSTELYMRGMTIHYPSTILFKDGELMDPFFGGVVTDKQMKAQIELAMGGSKDGK